MHLGRLNVPPDVPDGSDEEDEEPPPPPPPPPTGKQHGHKSHKDHRQNGGGGEDDQSEYAVGDDDEFDLDLEAVIPPGPGRSSPVHVGRINAPPPLPDYGSDEDPLAEESQGASMALPALGAEAAAAKSLKGQQARADSHADDDDDDDPLARQSNGRGLSAVEIHHKKHHHERDVHAVAI